MDLGTDVTLCENEFLEKNKILNVNILWIRNHEISTDYVLRIISEIDSEINFSLFTIK